MFQQQTQHPLDLEQHESKKMMMTIFLLKCLLTSYTVAKAIFNCVDQTGMVLFTEKFLCYCVFLYLLSWV